MLRGVAQSGSARLRDRSRPCGREGSGLRSEVPGSNPGVPIPAIQWPVKTGLSYGKPYIAVPAKETPGLRRVSPRSRSSRGRAPACHAEDAGSNPAAIMSCKTTKGAIAVPACQPKERNPLETNQQGTDRHTSRTWVVPARAKEGANRTGIPLARGITSMYIAGRGVVR